MRGDYQAALIAKVIADVNSKKGRNKFVNFLLDWKRSDGKREVTGGGGRFDEDEQASDPS